MNMTESTVGAALAQAAARLRAVAERPHLEAERLLAAVLGRERPWLLAHPEAPLAAEALADFWTRVERRLAHEPLPYLLGEAEFFGLSFRVTPAVLIPRPETEQLVELALAWLRAHPQARRVADVGTGSGCIAVSVAYHAPLVQVEALDISAEALEVARGNAQRHGVADRVYFHQGHLLEPLITAVDVLLSNPPYVADEAWLDLPPSVQREPRLALLGGKAGLDLIAALLEQAPRVLKPGGLLLLEIGAQQGAAVLALAQAAFPGAKGEVLRDSFGLERFLRVELEKT